MAVSSSTLTLTAGQASNLTITLTPAGGFNSPINLGCSGLPTGATCTFSPASVTPNGAPVTSTVSITVASQTSLVPTHAPPGAPDGRIALGWVMPWGFISMLGLGAARRRSRISEWSYRATFAAFLIAGALWIAGCGGGSSSSAGSGGGGGSTSQAATSFTLTIISTAPGTANQSSQITVNVQS
jgi:hypothetical protein